MTFFNPKEEVIEIEMTQYGKSLLAKGKFRPAYYAFFDDDILYDSSYAGFSEIQNKTELRIQNETPRSHIQHVFSSIENNINKELPLDGVQWQHTVEEGWTFTYVHSWDDPVAAFQINRPTEDKYALGLCLGDSSNLTTYSPAWSVNYVQGQLTASTDYLARNNLPPLQIPQLEATVEFEVYTTKKNSVTGDLEENYVSEKLESIASIFEEEEAVFGDGTMFQVKPDYLLLEVLEENTEFLKENFDIEVFLVEDAQDELGGEIQIEQQLLFFDPENEDEISPGHVEHYIDLAIDEEIISEYFCAADMSDDKKQSILADKPHLIDCIDNAPTRDLYEKEIKDIEEPC